jgi:hypothetical protein
MGGMRQMLAYCPAMPLPRTEEALMLPQLP